MPNSDRVIFHCDMNAYFASVEELLHPHLRDVPMAICGNPESRRGIIVAKNEKAKRYGVKTAETIYAALKKCPGLVLRPPQRHLYSEYCDKANAIYGSYTDLLEPASIDESYLDVTGTLHLFGNDAEKLAHEIRLRIQKELCLTISVGVSYNKFFAKMGSELKKPNAVTMITRDNYREKLWPLKIGEMHMVGKSAEATLIAMNIRTIGALAETHISTLVHKFGKFGEYLHANANGLDTSPVLSVDSIHEAQSIGNGITFKRNLMNKADIITAVNALSDTVASRLRREGFKCMTVQVTIKDANLKVITRQKKLPVATWLAADLAVYSMELIDTHWPKGKPIRLLSVTAMKLIDRDLAVEQLSLLDTPLDQATRQRRERLELAMDAIRGKYGSESITTAGIAYNDLGIHEDYGAEDD